MRSTAPSWPLNLRAAAQEVRAVARLAALLPLDWAHSPLVSADVDDVVVLVHGTMASAGAWRPLRAELSALKRLHSTAFSYTPMKGIADVAGLIGECLSRLPPSVRVHLVGHSLGGLAVRWFVQETTGDDRVVQTISVAAPFDGARGATLLPGPAGRDLRAGSPTLARLAESAMASKVPHLSIFGAADTAVDPATTFPVGERLMVLGAGHNGLLFHPEVVGHVRERVNAARNR